LLVFFLVAEEVEEDSLASVLASEEEEGEAVGFAFLSSLLSSMKRKKGKRMSMKNQQKEKRMIFVTCK
jgi:hypothetical protein